MIHIEKDGKAACQKKFTLRTELSRNYETTSIENFKEYVSGKSNYANGSNCCKKCKKLI